MKTLMLAIGGLLLMGCASLNTPYDAPVVGEDGVAQVVGVERWEYPEARSTEINEVLVFHAVMDDGRSCDFAYMKFHKKWAPDHWFAIHRQRQVAFGVFAGIHFQLPEDICLTVVRRGEQDE